MLGGGFPLLYAASEGREEVSKMLLGQLESHPSEVKDQLHRALATATYNGQNR